MVFFQLEDIYILAIFSNEKDPIFVYMKPSLNYLFYEPCRKCTLMFNFVSTYFK